MATDPLRGRSPSDVRAALADERARTCRALTHGHCTAPMIGDCIIHRAHPPGLDRKAVSLRLDKDILDCFRTDGPG